MYPVEDLILFYGALFIVCIVILTTIVIATSFLNFQIKKSQMATKEQFDAVMQRIDNTTNDLAAEIKSLRDKIAGQGLPQDVEDEVLAGFTAVADRLEQVGKEPAPPEGSSETPPVEEPPTV